MMNIFFPNNFFLFQIRNESTFIVAFVPKIEEGESNNTYVFRRFQLKSFIADTYKKIKSNEFMYIRYKMIDVFSMDDYEIFCYTHLYIEKTEYRITCFNYDFIQKTTAPISDKFSTLANEIEVFLKSAVLKDNYVAFIYFTEENKGNTLRLLIYHFIDISIKSKRVNLINFNINGTNFNTEREMSDFLKLDEKSVVFISTER